MPSSSSSTVLPTTVHSQCPLCLLDCPLTVPGRDRQVQTGICSQLLLRPAACVLFSVNAFEPLQGHIDSCYLSLSPFSPLFRPTTVLGGCLLLLVVLVLAIPPTHRLQCHLGATLSDLHGVPWSLLRYIDRWNTASPPLFLPFISLPTCWLLRGHNTVLCPSSHDGFHDNKPGLPLAWNRSTRTPRSTSVTVSARNSAVGSRRPAHADGFLRPAKPANNSLGHCDRTE